MDLRLGRLQCGKPPAYRKLVFWYQAVPPPLPWPESGVASEMYWSFGKPEAYRTGERLSRKWLLIFAQGRK